MADRRRPEDDHGAKPHSSGKGGRPSGRPGGGPTGRSGGKPGGRPAGKAGRTGSRDQGRGAPDRHGPVDRHGPMDRQGPMKPHGPTDRHGPPERHGPRPTGRASDRGVPDGPGGPAADRYAADRGPRRPMRGGPPPPSQHRGPWRPSFPGDTAADQRRPGRAYDGPGIRGGPDRGPGRRPFPDPAVGPSRPGYSRPGPRPPYRGGPPGDRPPWRPFDRGNEGPGGRPWPRPGPGPDPWPRANEALPPPDLLAADEELVAGRRPVEEVFAAGRTAHRMLVVPQRRKALEQLVLHATRLRIPIVEVEGGSLTAIAGFDGHQGIALVVEPRRFATLDDVLARAAERRRATVRARPRFARGSAECRDPAAQRRGGRRSRHRLPDPAPGAAQPGRGQGLGRGGRAPPALSRSTISPARWPTSTHAVCASSAPRPTRR